MNKGKWIRLYFPTLIPRSLVEQAALSGNFSVKDFFDYHNTYAANEIDNMVILSQVSFLYGLCIEDNRIEGFTWLDIEPVTRDLRVKVWRLEEKWWDDKEEIINSFVTLVETLKERFKCSQVQWKTKYTKFLEKRGFKRHPLPILILKTD